MGPRKASERLDIQGGDKVRLKSISWPSNRARVVSFDGDVVIAVLDSGGLVSIDADEITNYSSAARRAWKSRPERHVGRPRGSVKDRISVTLRVDRQIWRRVQALESAGVLTARTEWLNAMLAHAVDALETEGFPSESTARRRR